MYDFVFNELLGLLSVIFLAVAFVFWVRSRRRRKKELERRRAMGEDIPEKRISRIKRKIF